jgi:hypothetical protein
MCAGPQGLMWRAMLVSGRTWDRQYKVRGIGRVLHESRHTAVCEGQGCWLMLDCTTALFRAVARLDQTSAQSSAVVCNFLTIPSEEAYSILPFSWATLSTALSCGHSGYVPPLSKSRGGVYYESTLQEVPGSQLAICSEEDRCINM